MSELRTQLESAVAAHQHAAYPGDLGAELLVAEEPARPLILRLFYAAGALATAAALTLAVMRFGAITGGDSQPSNWRHQLASLGDRGRALVMSVSSGLPNDWELPSLNLPHMSRPSEFPQHLRMMSPLNRVQQPKLPDKLLPGQDEQPDPATKRAA